MTIGAATKISSLNRAVGCLGHCCLRTFDCGEMKCLYLVGSSQICRLDFYFN